LRGAQEGYLNDDAKQVSAPPTSSESKSVRHLRLWLLPLIVIALGGVGAALTQKAKPKEARAARDKVARAVTVAPLQAKTRSARIQGRGSVEPEREVTIIPEVSGRVVFVSKNLIAGGRVRKDEILLRIDPRSYKQQVDREHGALKNAELQVEVEKNQKQLAEYETEALGQVGQRSPIATREGYVAAAQASVEAQKSAIASAQLNLQRTVIKAPFDATVVSDNVDTGQVVHPQSQLARLIATSELRVEVSVPLEDLQMFDFPEGDQPGARAIVRQELPRGQKVEREGSVSRLVQELDASTRRARVLVRVVDPFDPSKGLPLLPGAHVEIEIEGKQLPELVAIDRKAVYDGDLVWLVGKDSKLKRQKIKIVWSDRDYVYAANDFAEHDRVVTTLLSTPIEGLPVRALEAPAALKDGTRKRKQRSDG
jgi:RND family efflux transporter MFP subunit